MWRTYAPGKQFPIFINLQDLKKEDTIESFLKKALKVIK